jgi:starch phosphorylase
MPTIRHEVPNHFSLPRRINRLGQLAYNLWWVWNPEGQMLFSQIDKPLWESVSHNPVAFLNRIDRPRLNAMTNDRYYLEYYDRVMRIFDNYMNSTDTWYKRTNPNNGRQVAYFSFEFGIHESLPVYAGGLGVLRWASYITRATLPKRSPRTAGRKPATRSSTSSRCRSSRCWTAMANR